MVLALLEQKQSRLRGPEDKGWRVLKLPKHIVINFALGHLIRNVLVGLE